MRQSVQSLNLSNDWATLIEEDRVGDPLQPDEFTPTMHAKETGLSLSRASAKLKMRFELGLLTRRKFGLHSWAYRPVKKGK